MTCKYFPDCIDGDECFFEHKTSINAESESESENGGQHRSFCPDGKNCSDQSCQFSESNHRDAGQILCRFQSNCNREKCSFKHNIARKAFLGEGSVRTKGT